MVAQGYSDTVVRSLSSVLFDLGPTLRRTYASPFYCRARFVIPQGMHAEVLKVSNLVETVRNGPGQKAPPATFSTRSYPHDEEPVTLRPLRSKRSSLSPCSLVILVASRDRIPCRHCCVE